MERFEGEVKTLDFPLRHGRVLIITFIPIFERFLSGCGTVTCFVDMIVLEKKEIYG